MPFLSEADPRKPKNRAHLLYLALERAGCIGHTLDRPAWDRILTVTMDANTVEARKRLRQNMEALGMIRNHATQGRSGGIEILPDGLRLL